MQTQLSKTTFLAFCTLFLMCGGKISPATASSSKQKTVSLFDVLRKEFLPATEKIESKQQRTKFVEELDEFSKMSGAYDLIEGRNPLTGEMYSAEFDVIDSEAVSKILSQEVSHDLSLFHGESDITASVFKQIDRTTTSFGRVMLQKMLLSPTSNAKTIQEQQKIITTLVENKELRKELKEQLAGISEQEDYLLSFYNYSQAKEEVAMQIAGARFSPKDLDGIKKRLKEVGLDGMVSIPNKLTTDWKKHNAFKAYMDLSMLNAIGVLSATSLTSIVRGVYMLSNPQGLDTIKGSYSVGFGALMLLMLLKLYLPMYGATIQTHKEMGATVNGVSKLFTQIKSIFAESENEEIANIPYVKEASEDMLLFSASDSMKELSTLLESSAVKNNSLFSYFFTLKGKVVAAFNIIKELRETDEFSSIMRGVGAIDAYVSIAELITEHKGSKNSYCFVDVLHSDSPYIKASGMWNPMIDAKSAIPNDFSVGAQEDARNIIISGPNAGGKSSFIKASILSLLMAQTFGIAPAKSFEFTPYDKINTYLNITDDIAKGRSLFQMEAERALNLAREIKSTPKNKFIISLMDELFSGTNPTEGAAAAYSIARSLGEVPNSTLIIASHFELMHRLEADSNGAFKNLKVSAKIRPISYDYQVKSGPSDQRIAIELLKEDGHDISDVLQYAEEIIEHPEKYGLK